MPTLTTRLAIIRHAWAEEVSASGDDASRPLTRKGRKRFARLLDRLVAGGLAIDVIATSPLLRARETADILAERVGGEPRIEVVAALAPGSDWRALVDWTIAQDARLVALSIGDGAAAIRMPKGAVASVRLDDGPGHPGELEWLATADLLGE